MSRKMADCRRFPVCLSRSIGRVRALDADDALTVEQAPIR